MTEQMMAMCHRMMMMCLQCMGMTSPMSMMPMR